MAEKHTDETTVWLLERPKEFFGANDRRTNVKEYLHYNDPEVNSMFMHTFLESPSNAMQFPLDTFARKYAEVHRLEGAVPVEVEVEVTLTFRFNR